MALISAFSGFLKPKTKISIIQKKRKMGIMIFEPVIVINLHLGVSFGENVDIFSVITVIHNWILTISKIIYTHR